MFRATRITLTVDDDVTALLKRLRKTRGTNLKDLINEALRRGLRDMTAGPKQRACSYAIGRSRSGTNSQYRQHW